MGYAYYQLVPAVVMHMNPGLTKEELSEVFLRTNLTTREIPVYRLIDQTWRHEIREKRNPLYDDSKPWQLEPSQPFYIEKTDEEKRNFIRTGNLSRWDNCDSRLFSGKKVSALHSGLYGLAETLCIPIRKPIRGSIHFIASEDFLKSRRVRVHYEDFEGRHIFFPNLKSFEESEEFDVRKNIDFSGEEGGFEQIYDAEKIFRWRQIKGRYYFDFQNMLDSLDVSGFEEAMRRYSEPCSYSDFVMTLEAVKRRAWKMLTYKGLQHRDNFFRKWPETEKIYEKAVFDSFISLGAKAIGMSNFELMRARLEGRL